MEQLTRDTFRRLIEAQPGHCVSLYLPNQPAGREFEEGPIRMKNLLNRAEDDLVDRGLRTPEARTILQPAREVADDPLFWKEAGQAVAMFLSASAMTMVGDCEQWPEMVVTGERFHVTPLLPAILDDITFYVLALSPDRVRLLHMSRSTATERQAQEFPSTFEELNRYIEPQKQLQFHTETPHYGPQGAKQGAIFFGHGGEPPGGSERKVRLLEYCRLIDQGLGKTLEAEKAPLLLAGDESLLAIYRQVSRYAHVSEDDLPGNPDDRKPEQLHQQAWPFIQQRLRRQRQRAVTRFQEALAHQRGSNRLEVILPAASQGRVGELLVCPTEQRWGRFDPTREQVELHGARSPHDEDLVNRAVIEVASKRGTLFAVPLEEMPGKAPLGAVYRY